VTELLEQYPWEVSAGLALLAAIVAFALHVFVGDLLRKHSHGAPIIHAILMAARRPAGYAVPLIALQIAWEAVPQNLPRLDGIRHLNGVLLIAALTWLVMCVFSGLADGVIARHPITVTDNMNARRVQTQARVLARSAMILAAMAGMAMALMTFPGARQVGASLLASAGVLGIVGGIAARPVFSNLISGLQLALAQPLRLDDVLIVNGQYGRVEEITGTYVVLRLWDERQMIVPLQWFIENPFENWTRSSSQILQSVYLHLDFATPLEPLREELQRLVESAPEWDGRVCNLVAVDTTERTMKVRALVSATESGTAFALGCKVREGLLAFVAREFPDSLPRVRHMEPSSAIPVQGAHLHEVQRRGH